MKLARIGAVIIGIFLIGMGIYALLHRQISFTEQEQLVDLNAIQPTTGEFPAIFSALLIVAGTTLIILQLVIQKKD